MSRNGNDVILIHFHPRPAAWRPKLWLPSFARRQGTAAGTALGSLVVGLHVLSSVVAAKSVSPLHSKPLLVYGRATPPTAASNRRLFWGVFLHPRRIFPCGAKEQTAVLTSVIIPVFPGKKLQPR